MNDIGAAALKFAFVTALYAVGIALLGVWRRRPAMVQSAERATYGVFGLVTIAMVAMLYALLAHDFRLQYVASVSNRAMPTFYVIAALWGGQEGSMLLWLWLLTMYSALVVGQNRYRNRELMPYVISTLMVTALLFLAMLVIVEDPFKRLAHEVRDGQGLNPLLQNPLMVIHPPNLYLGFVGFAVPFAFAIGALASGRLDTQWIRSIRRLTLVAWLFLGVGILLGGQWAYVELGWGGYWAWDPVENASFMPWLTGTAFLHSVMMQEKKGMMKSWNVWLIFSTFLLTLLGTLLTRAGLVSSVHAFAQSSIGTWFVIFMGIVLAVCIFTYVFQRSHLKSDHQLESLVSRESSFLFNNLVLLTACFVILWGTLFPILSEYVVGNKVTVGAPFYNRVAIPIGLFLLFLTGVGPLLPWRATSLRSIRRNFVLPSITLFATIIICLAVGVRPWEDGAFSSGNFYALVAFALSASVF